MDIPPASHRVWSDIVTGKLKFDFECLALKILLARLQVQVSNDRMNVQRCAAELRNFFEKNQKLPSAQRDLTKLFG